MTDAPTLLILYAGGTVGMVDTSHGLAPGKDFAARLDLALAGLPPARRLALPDFNVIELPDPIDSSAATPRDWQRLAKEITRRNREYAGIVVLHGTDTLAWSASSLAYQLQGIDRPVVVTGAMQPLEAQGSDALNNIEMALRFAILPALQEVTIAFAGKLMRAVRSRKRHTQSPDAFFSPNYPLLGEWVNHDAVFYADRSLTTQQRGAPRFELPDYNALADGGIARLVLWPGISARQVTYWLEDDLVRGALLEVWGGGNLPDDPALLGVLARASGEGKLLAAISQCPQGGIAPGHYAAGRALAETGVLSGDDMTPEAALTKITHLLAQPLSEAQRQQRFLSSLVGER
ncbi:asparaginase [Halomonas sp. TRM85114]|uniref:asparaginase n=1 Tax=Halomonas jincaotanensis TaxID=2810616 RepID=UPI001BD39037|nr:asparaginase [Halomonas jincaotanensis]MBS9404118.1 asparaginase [Halomonas jincaotanensis]